LIKSPKALGAMNELIFIRAKMATGELGEL
jgi:hypothetical protein